jgi:hypothetical protein
MAASVRRPHSLFALLALIFFTAALAGCGGNQGASGPKVKARGRILKNGLPIKSETATQHLPPGDPGLQVIFIKVGTADAGAEIPATVIDASEGTFELTGPDGKGIPPGRYRVAVLLAPIGSADAFKGKYDRDNSKIEVELKDGEDLVIDLDKPKG